MYIMNADAFSLGQANLYEGIIRTYYRKMGTYLKEHVTVQKRVL